MAQWAPVSAFSLAQSQQQQQHQQLMQPGLFFVPCGAAFAGGAVEPRQQQQQQQQWRPEEADHFFTSSSAHSSPAMVQRFPSVEPGCFGEEAALREALRLARARSATAEQELRSAELMAKGAAAKAQECYAAGNAIHLLKEELSQTNDALATAKREALEAQRASVRRPELAKLRTELEREQRLLGEASARRAALVSDLAAIRSSGHRRPGAGSWTGGGERPAAGPSHQAPSAASASAPVSAVALRLGEAKQRVAEAASQELFAAEERMRSECAEELAARARSEAAAEKAREAAAKLEAELEREFPGGAAAQERAAKERRLTTGEARRRSLLEAKVAQFKAEAERADADAEAANREVLAFQAQRDEAEVRIREAERELVELQQSEKESKASLVRLKGEMSSVEDQVKAIERKRRGFAEDLSKQRRFNKAMFSFLIVLIIALLENDLAKLLN